MGTQLLQLLLGNLPHAAVGGEQDAASRAVNSAKNSVTFVQPHRAVARQRLLPGTIAAGEGPGQEQSMMVSS